MNKRYCLCLCLLWCFLSGINAEDGSRLWLRQSGGSNVTVLTPRHSPTMDITVRELQQAWKGSPVSLVLKKDKLLQKEGYHIRREAEKIVLTSPSETGLLYAAYHLIRLQSSMPPERIAHAPITENPAYDIRILNHWDNLDRSVERGYAGRSLWEWESLPGSLSERYAEYARANASIGINGTVLNNVNASSEILSPAYIEKVKALAEVFRPYGIRVYLSVNFASPMQLGGLTTADPLDKEVIEWWKGKVKEIYQAIPDFGGFLVKANSEGQPGPYDFGRTHADGANMLADALKPYKGIVMWRAFVYNPDDRDRAKQAYLEFQPLDGKFRKNVIIQIKNGPVDFQPREPHSPLFGAMPHTSQMVEFQITQEYLGFSNHLAYLAPMWKEFLGFVSPTSLKAMAGVSNIGTDRNWCGHIFAQANWYAFGRLAWNPNLSPEEIATEWLQQTFDGDDSFVKEISSLMMQSREAVVDYMMPLGLHHLFAWGHHYGPEPWCEIPGARPDWLPTYYHQASNAGVGFNRSSTGSNATAQYNEELRKVYDNAESCPDEYLLWFHHVPWTHKMQSGRTLWDELCFRYDRGVREVRLFQRIWDKQERQVDSNRFKAVQSRLKTQLQDAVWWKDACLLYFQTFSGMPIPYDIERPIYDLEELKQIKLPIDNHENATREILNRAFRR